MEQIFINFLVLTTAKNVSLKSKLILQVAKITKALIEADLHDEEVDEELERFRERRTKDAAAEEREANAALVSQSSS